MSRLPLSTTNVPRDEIIFAVLTPPISLQSCNDDTVLNMGECKAAMFSRRRKLSLKGLLCTTPIKSKALVPKPETAIQDGNVPGCLCG